MESIDVKTITRYKYGGVEYESLKKVKEHIENKIGSDIIDSFGTLPPKTRLEILSVLTNKVSRELLVGYLTINFTYKGDDGELFIKNILDV